jgi:RimJ/RimL family protein N-acetyltransferase
MAVTTRKALEQDIPMLIQFQQQLAFETEGVELKADTLKKGLTAMFEDQSKGYYNIIQSDDEVAGCFMIAYEWSDWRNGWAYWLHSLYIKESFRQRGIFREVFNQLLTSIKHDPGIVGLRLYVDKSNVRAQKAYSAMGMNGEHYSVFEWMK